MSDDVSKRAPEIQEAAKKGKLYQAGKGDTPRKVKGDAYRDGWERVFGKGKKK